MYTIIREKNSTKTSKIQLLKKVAFLAELSDFDLHQIESVTVERSYEQGAVIIEENTAAERFLIICEGKIEISKRFEDGEQFVLGVHSDGEFFGEMAILDEGPRSATARALVPTTLLEITRTDFETLLYKSPVLAFSIMKALSSRLRETGALLISHLQRKNRQLAKAYLDTVRTVVGAIEERDLKAKGHTDRVNAIAKAIGRHLGLTDEEMFNLEIGSLLHDMGMISVPEAILLKPGPLEESERREMQKHPDRGKQMIERFSFLEAAIPNVLHHHERVDGSGYPGNLSGSAIPLAARIIAVADVFAAVTRERAHRGRLDFAQAQALIKQGQGTEFDSEVVDAFFQAVATGEIAADAE